MKQFFSKFLFLYNLFLLIISLSFIILKLDINSLDLLQKLFNNLINKSKSNFDNTKFEDLYSIIYQDNLEDIKAQDDTTKYEIKENFIKYFNFKVLLAIGFSIISIYLLFLYFNQTPTLDDFIDKGPFSQEELDIIVKLLREKANKDNSNLPD